ncbi:acyl carrier protein [Arcobacter sp. F155]|uniref:phosphopantetheine-binding protein n=1 Tax=Arcobacteraceae TaxID=2808963 RepID=UPI00100A2FCA|nr:MULTISPECIES: phosphopantetheine-binding protein [unclassified Arcobacter]NVJ54421.1 acyl carrier protein [Campylobacteraceae bacterium]RXJ76725.1 acyl carrier protein [Arcobacter sp. F155]RXK02254.1 acyl carrier protein [Arcobacter sp. CECT 8989]
MIGSKDEKLKLELKELIIEECDKDIEPEDISDDEVLFGSDTELELDSMDALQISMALHKKYGIDANDSKKLRKIMASINTLADHIQPE